jgi:hypothetical protein
MKLARPGSGNSIHQFPFSRAQRGRTGEGKPLAFAGMAGKNDKLGPSKPTAGCPHPHVPRLLNLRELHGLLRERPGVELVFK